MYCSHCGYKLKNGKIYKTIEKDQKNANNIKYLAKLFLSSLSRKLKINISLLKEQGLSKDEFNSKVALLKEENNKIKLEANEKLHANDLNYFKNKLNYNDERKATTLDSFACPRCGSVIKHNLEENDIKALARAAHSEIHRGRNNISSGMCGLMIGIILACIGFMFLALSFKATNGGKLDPQCVEFYVFIALVLFGFILIVYAFVNLIRGKSKIKRYEELLKEINNGAFHQ